MTNTKNNLNDLDTGYILKTNLANMEQENTLGELQSPKWVEIPGPIRAAHSLGNTR